MFGLFQKKSQNTSKINRIGVAFGGGGARGFAHLGMMQAMQEQGVICDHIAGSSAGALAGALLASGKTPQEAHELMKSKDLFSYTKLQWPREGLFSLNGLKKILVKELPERIEDLQIPMTISTTNLNKGMPEHFTQGPLVDIIIASSSIPFIYRPILINGQKYADGGVMENLPIRPLIRNSEKIIALSISPIEEIDDLGNLIKIAARTFQLSIHAQIDDLRSACSLFIEPEALKKFQIHESDKADEIYKVGYDHVSKMDINQLLKLR